MKRSTLAALLLVTLALPAVARAHTDFAGRTAKPPPPPRQSYDLVLFVSMGTTTAFSNEQSGWSVDGDLNAHVRSQMVLSAALDSKGRLVDRHFHGLIAFTRYPGPHRDARAVYATGEVDGRSSGLDRRDPSKDPERFKCGYFADASTFGKHRLSWVLTQNRKKQMVLSVYVLATDETAHVDCQGGQADVMAAEGPPYLLLGWGVDALLPDASVVRFQVASRAAWSLPPFVTDVDLSDHGLDSKAKLRVDVKVRRLPHE